MTRFVIALFAALLPFTTAFAQDERRAEVTLVSERAQAVAGETFYLALDMTMDDGWHVYWRNAGDAGLPPEIIWNETPLATPGAFVWPIPHELPVVPGEIMDYGYDGRLVLPFPVTVPADASGELTFDGLADYLICKDICIPEAADITLTVQVGTEQIPDVIAGEAIADALSKTPETLEGQARIDRSGSPWRLSIARDAGGFGAVSYARFFPFEHEIVHAADQPVSLGPDGLTLSLTPDDEDATAPLEGVLVVERDGKQTGYTIAAAPGAVLDSTSGEPLGVQAGGAPINLLAILGLAFIGGLILNLMPCVLPVLSIKALGMVHAATSGEDRAVRAHGIWYTAGVLVSFLAIAAAFLGVRAATGTANLGFQLQEPAMVIGLILIVFLIGLWLLGMFELGASVQNVGSGLAAKQGSTGAFFTGVLAAVVGAPCVGPFLGVALGAVITQPAGTVFTVFLAMGLGLAAPFLALSFAPGLQRLLPKPGAWMETLKQFFAFPMFLTAAWLLAVLGALTDYSTVGWTVAGGAALAFGLWLMRNLPSGGLRRIVQGVAVAALVFGAAGPIWRVLAPEPVPAYANLITGDWSPEVVQDHVAEGRGVFVDFTAVWCATCQVNKRTTLETDAVKQAFAETETVFLTADFTRKDPIIAEALKRHQRPGVPMYLYYAPGEAEPQVLPEVLSQGLVVDLVSGG